MCVTDDASRTTAGAARGRPAAVRPSRRTAVARPSPRPTRPSPTAAAAAAGSHSSLLYVDARPPPPPDKKSAGPVTWSTRLPAFCPRRRRPCGCDARRTGARASRRRRRRLSLVIAATRCPSRTRRFNTCVLRVPADAERFTGANESRVRVKSDTSADCRAGTVNTFGGPPTR